ncbi:MAG: hypothetical protein JRG80_21615 [Deltaproteobacteria bacterium]|nr:hypothetical protein [Deltaproteobacteria bacterium]
MISRHIAVLAVLAALLPIAAASRAADDQQEPTHPPAQQPQQPYNAEGQRITGTVVSTSDVAGYTYVQLDTDDGIIWAAAPRTPVQEGDIVLLPDGAPMAGFYSSSLERRFDMIYFASSMQVHRSGAAGTMDLAEHCPPGLNAADVDVSDIEPAAGGLTVAQILERKADLAGKQVSLRGKVVKCSPGILGKTSLLVQGTVGLDKDFGYGYRYDLLIEDASITSE